MRHVTHLTHALRLTGWGCAAMMMTMNSAISLDKALQQIPAGWHKLVRAIYERLERHNQRGQENVSIEVIREYQGRLELLTTPRNRKALQIDLQALCDSAAAVCRQCGAPAASKQGARARGLCLSHQESR